jgi:hypothetical protein
MRPQEAAPRLKAWIEAEEKRTKKFADDLQQIFSQGLKQREGCIPAEIFRLPNARLIFQCVAVTAINRACWELCYGIKPKVHELGEVCVGIAELAGVEPNDGIELYRECVTFWMATLVNAGMTKRKRLAGCSIPFLLLIATLIFSVWFSQ